MPSFKWRSRYAATLDAQPQGDFCLRPEGATNAADSQLKANVGESEVGGDQRSEGLEIES